MRDIPAGEELTGDYGTLNIREPLRCLCGAPDCRGWVLPDDLLHHGAQWEASVKGVFPLIPTVPQPLWPLLKDGERTDVEAALRDPGQIRAIFTHYSPPPVDDPTAPAPRARPVPGFESASARGVMR